MNDLSTSDAPLDHPGDATTFPEPRPFYWSVRRELWENRLIWLVPVIIAAFVLFASSFSTIGLAARMRNIAESGKSVNTPFNAAPAAIMFASLLVGFFYCFDALYGERRDRSILFWKSLPVSDRTTVLSKVAIPMVVLPVIAYLLSVAVQLLLLQYSSVVLILHGVSPLRLWSEVQFFQGLPIMFYGLFVHELWFAPIYGWFLLVSAWSKRLPMVWALLPVFLLLFIETAIFHSKFFVKLLKYRVTGAMEEAFAFKGGDVSRLDQLTPIRFFLSSGLWLGLLFAAAAIAMAIRLRRNREPI